MILRNILKPSDINKPKNITKPMYIKDNNRITESIFKWIMELFKGLKSIWFTLIEFIILLISALFKEL